MPTRSSSASPMPTMPPQQTLMPAVAHMFERVEPVLVAARGDDLAVEFRRGVEIVVVVVEAGVFQPARLSRLEHAERDAGLHAQRLHALDHGADLVEIAVLRRTPGRAHAEARGAAGLGRARLGRARPRDPSACSAFDAGVEFRRLRAIGAVLRAAAGLDRQQGRNLHLGRIEILPMHLRPPGTSIPGTAARTAPAPPRASSRGAAGQFRRAARHREQATFGRPSVVSTARGGPRASPPVKAPDTTPVKRLARRPGARGFPVELRKSSDFRTLSGARGGARLRFGYDGCRERACYVY